MPESLPIIDIAPLRIGAADPNYNKASSELFAALSEIGFAIVVGHGVDPEITAHMRAAVIDGKAIGAKIRAEVAKEATDLRAQGWVPRLVSISVGDVAAAELYVRNQSRSAESAGVAFEARNYPADISLEQLIGVLQGLNGDPRVNGIIIQRP